MASAEMALQLGCRQTRALDSLDSTAKFDAPAGAADGVCSSNPHQKTQKHPR